MEQQCDIVVHMDDDDFYGQGYFTQVAGSFFNQNEQLMPIQTPFAVLEVIETSAIRKPAPWYPMGFPGLGG